MLSLRRVGRFLAAALGLGVGLLPSVTLAGQTGEPSPVSAATSPEEEPAETRLLIRGFGNIDWLTERKDVPQTFSLGQLDLYLSSELSEDVSVLAEIVFEAVEGEQEAIIDVERYQIRYSPADVLNVAVGRMHSSLGFWNQTYHHGAWLQTTAFRPEIYRFEDEGGLLPIHEVGLRLFGATRGGDVRVEYDASLANGRGQLREDVVNLQDPNGSKAVRLWVGLAPRAWRGLQIGGVACFDRIPPIPADPSRERELDERILGGFFAFQRAGTEALFEAFDIRHEDEGTGDSYRTTGLYAQAAQAFGRVTPYYRFDWIDRDEADPFYLDGTPSQRKHTLGVRVDVRSRLALRVDLSHTDLRDGEAFRAAAVQAAFTF